MHLITHIAASTAPAEETSQGFIFDPLTIFMVLAIGVLIFFMFRNNKKRKEQAAELETKMVPGAEVMTNFGLFGTLVDVDDDTNEALLEIAPGVQVRVHRQTLARVVEPELDGSHDDIDADDAGDANPDSTDDRR